MTLKDIILRRIEILSGHADSCDIPIYENHYLDIIAELREWVRLAHDCGVVMEVEKAVTGYLTTEEKSELDALQEKRSGMTFEQALTAMRNGARVRRAGWGDWIRVSHIDMEHLKSGNTLSSDGILATDWYIV